MTSYFFIRRIMSHEEIFKTIFENIFSDADGREVSHLRHHLQQLQAQQDACTPNTISDWQHALGPNDSAGKQDAPRPIRTHCNLVNLSLTCTEKGTWHACSSKLLRSLISTCCPTNFFQTTCRHHQQLSCTNQRLGAFCGNQQDATHRQPIQPETPSATQNKPRVETSSTQELV